MYTAELVAVWFMLNTVLNFANRIVLSPDALNFPSPFLYTLCHMFSSSVYGACRCKRRMLVREIKIHWRFLLLSGLCNALSIALNNMSLVHISVGLNQLIKACVPLPTLVFERLMLRKSHTGLEVVSTILIVGGAAIVCASSSTDASISYGIAAAVASCILTALRSVLAMLLLQKNELPLVHVLTCDSIVSTAILIPLVCVFELRRFVEYVMVLSDLPDAICSVVITSVCAVSYNHITLAIASVMSSLSITMLSTCRQTILLLLSMGVEQTIVFTASTAVGIAQLILGTAVYTISKTSKNYHLLLIQLKQQDEPLTSGPRKCTRIRLAVSAVLTMAGMLLIAELSRTFSTHVVNVYRPSPPAAPPTPPTPPFEPSPPAAPPTPPTLPSPMSPPDPYHLAACVVHGTPATVIGMVATNARYFAGVVDFAEAARAEAPCVVASVSNSVVSTHERVRSVKLPLAAAWQPETQFCHKGLSGWRHVGVLKTQLLVTVLHQGFDCFLVDSDWRPTTTFGPTLSRLAHSWDVAATPDPTHSGAQLLNIGLMWVRRSAQTLDVAERVANRTYAAWDQLVFNQELHVASDLTCCTSSHVLQAAFVRGGVSHTVSDEAKHDSSAQEPCTESRPPLDALPPPVGCSGECASVFPHWRVRNYNDESARLTPSCISTPCNSDLTVPTGWMLHTHTNCFTGSGSLPVTDDDEVHSIVDSLQTCIDSCNGVGACDGVLLRLLHGHLHCYQRHSIDVDRCRHGAGQVYDLYVRQLGIKGRGA